MHAVGCDSILLFTRVGRTGSHTEQMTVEPQDPIVLLFAND